MNIPPHQRALRIGRASIAGSWYSVTSCIAGRRPLLVPDKANPLAGATPARIVQSCIRWLHVNGRWQCKAYVVMPDHVHIVFELGGKQDLGGVMAAFGKYTARKLNTYLDRRGPVWQHGFYDHCLRQEQTYLRHLLYVVENPVRKGFVQCAEDWPFSEIEPEW